MLTVGILPIVVFRSFIVIELKLGEFSPRTPGSTGVRLC